MLPLHSLPPKDTATDTTGVEGIPRHVAIIMDGNGRWAKAHNVPRAMGHKRGAEALRSILTACPKLGVQYLTVYAFSSENWQRPQQEISDLMELLKFYLDREIKTLTENGIRLHVIGNLEQLSDDVRRQVAKAEDQTADNSAFHLTVCLSYGARQEIATAFQKLAGKVADGTLSIDRITPEHIDEALYTHALPEPDLLIRTGGDQRLSNFLLWQCAYTELYFTDILWPDFTPEALTEACRVFASRERRYGKRT